MVFLEQKSPELAAIVTAWPNLPDHIRQAIITLVESVREGKSAKE